MSETASLASWIIFNIIIFSILALDLLILHRKAHAVSIKEALLWSGIWIGLALLFDGYLFFSMGEEAATNFLTGYLIEKSLSIDNLFVFLLIFDYFQTPKTSLHKVLFWGVLGAIITRAAFILLGVALIHTFHFVVYLFGIFLIITGLRFLFKKEKSIHPEKNPILRLFRRLIPLTPNYQKDRFFILKNSKLLATPLFLVLLYIETTDILFAIDSIPAILAITTDSFIVYTSNIFAILGLRSLFFVLEGTLKIFGYLHYGIALILIFVGAKMLLSGIFTIPPLLALTIILTLFILSLLPSLFLKKRM